LRPPFCADWLQVNDGAFGLGTGGDSNYAAEEGFEVLVYQNRLYVGMEADNTLGARLWRTKAGVTVANGQEDWEEVIADAAGCPFGNCNRQGGLLQNDHIDSLAAFNGFLYASTANGGNTTQGTQVWRSASGDPGSWEQVNDDGFGDPDNTNFKDMQVFDGYLCGGTQNWDWANRDTPAWAPGAQVWCTQNGTDWLQKNANGFGDGANIEVWSGYVFDGALYFGVQNFGANRGTSGDDVGKLYRTFDLDGAPIWSEVYSGAPGSFRIDILGDLHGYLYISERSANGIRILRSPSGDPGTWVLVNTPGMNGNPQNIGTVVDGATVFDDLLFVGVTNLVTGFEVWQTAGQLQPDGRVDWQQVGTSGLGDPHNLYVELIPFGPYLYAWTSNYVSGQQVRRSTCPASTPTPTPTATSTPTPTPTDTPIPTPTDTPTPTNTPTPTPTPTNTPTSTPTPTNTPTSTPTRKPTRTPTPSGSLIFADGFESGTLGAWSGAVTDGSDLTVTAAAALVGTRGLQATVNDNNPLYVYDTRPANETHYRARFRFHPNGIAMADGDTHTLFAARQGNAEVFRLLFRRKGSNYQLRAQIRNDATTYTATSWYTIANAAQVIEIEWQAATTPGANNGALRLWLNGTLRQTLSGIDNDTRRVDEVRLGPQAGIDNGTRGVMYLDHFESWR
jgi:hypothetical protein